MRSVLLVFVLVFCATTGRAAELPVQMDEEARHMAQTMLQTMDPTRTDERLDRLAARMHMEGVQIFVSEVLGDNAMYVPGIIIMGDKLAALPEPQAAFFLAHEYGHHLREHWQHKVNEGLLLANRAGVQAHSLMDLGPFLTKALTTKTLQLQEYEADASAVELLQQANLYDAASVRQALETICQEGDMAHPPGMKRAAHLTQASRSQ